MRNEAVQHQHTTEAPRSRAVSLSEAARLLGKHRNTVSGWLAKGLPFVAPADRAAGREWQLDLGQVLEWFAGQEAARARAAEKKRIAALEARLASLEGAAPGACSVEEARRRRAAARARIDEIELATIEDKMIDFDLCCRFLASLLASVRDRLLALHVNLSPELAGMASVREVADRIEARVRDALMELAEGGEVAAKEIINRALREQRLQRGQT